MRRSLPFLGGPANGTPGSPFESLAAKHPKGALGALEEQDRDRDGRGLGHGTRRRAALRARGRAGRPWSTSTAAGVEAVVARDHRGGRPRARDRRGSHPRRRLAAHRVGDRAAASRARLRLEPRRPSRPRRGRGHRHEGLRSGHRPQPAHRADHDRGGDPGAARARRRRLLFTASTSGLQGSPFSPVYSMCKFGVVGLRAEPGVRLAPRRSA